MAEDEHRAHQHVEQLLLGLDGAVDEARAQRVAGVVDEQVDRPGRVAQPLGDPLELHPVGQVGRQDLDGHPVPPRELAGHRRQPGLVAGDEDEVDPLRGELLGELAPDAGGGAGDQCRAHAPSTRSKSSRSSRQWRSSPACWWLEVSVIV